MWSLSKLCAAPYYKLRRFIPLKFLYHPDFFKVQSIIKDGNNDPHIIEREINARLRSILSDAVINVPFYREHVKISPQAILSHPNPAELIHEFPYIDKATVMKQQDRFLNDRYRGKRIHYAASGGSTGQGMGLWRNKRLADIEKAFFEAEWGRFGFSFARSRYVRIGGDARRQEHEHPLRVNGNRLMLSPYHLHERWAEQIVDGLNEYKPDYIHSYPSAMFELCKLVEKRQLKFRPKALLLASEPIMDYQLAYMQRLFQCPISFNYGLTERTNIAFGTYIDGVRSDNHLNPLYSFSENREKDGQSEIVGTSLWNDVTPLIRYCTGDFGTIENNTVIKKIEGRSQEFLISKEGGRISGISIFVEPTVWDFVKHIQVYQYTPGEISFRVVPREGPLSEKQKEMIMAGQLHRWGQFFNITLDEVADIPLTAAGKRRFILNEAIV